MLVSRLVVALLTDRLWLPMMTNLLSNIHIFSCSIVVGGMILIFQPAVCSCFAALRLKRG